MLTITIIFAILCAAVFYLDVYSSASGNKYPGIKEKRKIFQVTIDGIANRCDVKKLAIFKSVLFAVCAAAVAIIWQLRDGSKFGWLVFALMTGITLPTVLHNFKLQRKHRSLPRGFILVDGDSTFSLWHWFANCVWKVFTFAVMRPKLTLFVSAAILIFALVILVQRGCENRKIERIEYKKEALQSNVNALEANGNLQNQIVVDAETDVNRAKENLNKIQNQNFNGVSGKTLDDMAANYK